MPLTRQVIHNGPQAHFPRYYDYTEDFESSRICSMTPAQPIAPVPTRIHNIQRAMVLREGSEEKLASGLGGKPSSAVDDTGSQCDDHETEPIPIYSNTGSQVQRTTLSARHPSFARCKGTYVPPKPSENNTRARCNDIDFLPSQASRVSTDEIYSSLDIDSRDTAVGTRQDDNWVASSKSQNILSGIQVQLQGFSDPAIRIEQVPDISTVSRKGQKSEGVYQTNDASGPQSLVGTGNTPVASSFSSKSTYDSTNAATEIKGRIYKTNGTTSPMVDQPATADPDTTEKTPKEDLGSTSENSEPKLSVFGAKMGDAVDHLGIHMQNVGPKSDQAAKRTTRAASDTKYGYRRHKRHNAAIDISREQAPGDTQEKFTRLVSASSGPPSVAPQPTSPAMQLRIKNSIPKLMKALPALPLTSENIIGRKYFSSSEGDRCSQILQPPGQPHLVNSTLLRTESTASAFCQGALENNPGGQKKLRKIRLRPRGAGSDSPRTAITKPQDEAPPQTKQHRDQSPGWVFEDEETFPLDCNHEKEPYEAKPYTLVPPETVRWHPGARGSPTVTAMATKPPKDLFTSANRLATMFQQTLIGEKDDQSDSNVVNKAQTATKDHLPAGELRDGKAGLTRRHEKEPGFRQPSESYDQSTVVYSRRLKNRISGIGWLVGRTGQGCWQNHPADRQGSGEKKDVLAETKGRMRGNGCECKGLTAGEKTSPEVSHGQRFGRRIRNKIAKWARETRNAMRGRGGIHQIDSVDRKETA